MKSLRWACIIPTWNSEDVVENCLLSVRGQKRAFDEVVVVDNCSNDGTKSVVRQFAPNKIIEFSSNRGFAAAINAGIQASTADLLVWLNADACLDENFLDVLNESEQRHPETGMFVPKIMLGERGQTTTCDLIENVGNHLWLDGLNWCIGRGEHDRGQFGETHTVMFPSGAVCAIRRVVFDAVGLLDESFFAYGEDADFGLRAFLAGYRCKFVATARARHLLSQSLGINSARKVYLVERNRILVAWKNFPVGILALSVLCSTLRYLGWLFALQDTSRVRQIVDRLGRTQMLKLIVRAHTDAAKMIVCGKISRHTSVSSSIEFLALVRPYVVAPYALIST